MFFTDLDVHLSLGLNEGIYFETDIHDLKNEVMSIINTQRWKLVFGALKWDLFGWFTTIFDKIAAFRKWQWEKIASLLED